MIIQRGAGRGTMHTHSTPPLPPLGMPATQALKYYFKKPFRPVFCCFALNSLKITEISPDMIQNKSPEI